jgi:ParB-like chromosome segregation protein Spo0J
MIDTGEILANDYNANEMEPEEFEQYLASLRRDGRLPKPLVVRLQGDDYVLIDGEHGWRGAKKLGWRKVPCEVLEADDFEAMRQSFTRNCHGRWDQDRLGRMFQLMLKAGKLSQRKLAKQIGTSDGTVRNALKYAEAAELRNPYALRKGSSPHHAEFQIARLTVEQVRAYIDLPLKNRDAWLDKGANLAEVEELAGRPAKEAKTAQASTDASTKARKPRSEKPLKDDGESEDVFVTEPQTEATDAPEPTAEVPQPAAPSVSSDAVASALAPPVSDDNPNPVNRETCPGEVNPITDAWNRASESERRAHLRTLRGDAAAAALVKEEFLDLL